MSGEPKRGARVAFLAPNKLLVQQTILKGADGRNPGVHVIEKDSRGKQIALHVDMEDDAAIGEAIRSAIRGTLSKPRRQLGPGSKENEEGFLIELGQEWDAMDETDAANAEYEFDLMQRDD